MSQKLLSVAELVNCPKAKRFMTAKSKWCALRLMKWLRNVLWNLEKQKITFTKTPSAKRFVGNF